MRLKSWFTDQVFAENTKYMGNGMADFIDKEILTVDEYDLYCHYVAGSCGIAVVKVCASDMLWSSEQLFDHFLSFKPCICLSHHVGASAVRVCM
jgi:phytoene/squalene synthetase